MYDFHFVSFGKAHNRMPRPRNHRAIEFDGNTALPDAKVFEQHGYCQPARQGPHFAVDTQLHTPDYSESMQTNRIGSGMIRPEVSIPSHLSARNGRRGCPPVHPATDATEPGRMGIVAATFFQA